MLSIKLEISILVNSRYGGHDRRGSYIDPFWAPRPRAHSFTSFARAMNATSMDNLVARVARLAGSTFFPAHEVWHIGIYIRIYIIVLYKTHP